MDPDEQRRLKSLRALKILDTPPEERFDRIARLAQRTLGVPIVLIAFIDDKRVWFKSRVGLEESEVPLNGSFCEATLSCDGLLIVPDAAADPRFAAHPLVAAGPRVRFYAGQPISAPDGSVVGTLSLLDRAPRDLDLEQRRTLRDLAGMVQEQLALSGGGVETDEHSRLLARLRSTPEHAAARRNVRAAFLAIATLLILATVYSLRLAHRLVDDAAVVESVLGAAGKPAALETAQAHFERLRSTARFFSVGVGVRGLMGLTLLLVVLVIFDRHLDSRLSALAAVELERARLKAVIDALGDGVVVADARGRFTLFNPAAERILGLGMVDDHETSRFYGSFFTDAGEACPREKHPLARAIAGETAHGERLIVRNDRRPGGVAVVVTATPVRSSDGGPAGGVIIFRDVL
ncbi:MAG: PAS domain-containing protein [Elusimicrobiota bacterium]|nr:PAS domain-containing protein [Elusimicrobiota bacterium]